MIIPIACFTTNEKHRYKYSCSPLSPPRKPLTFVPVTLSLKEVSTALSLNGEKLTLLQIRKNRNSIVKSEKAKIVGVLYNIYKIIVNTSMIYYII